MSVFPESLRAYAFQSGIDRISDAYTAAAATMARAVDDAKKAADDYEQSGADDSEYDEDGVLLRSTRHELDQLQMEAGLAATVVREAFVTSAFHYWERAARKWTGLRGQTFWKLRDRSAQLYPVSPELSNLHRLNNLLKHDRDQVDHSLLDSRPDYFVDFSPSRDRKDPKKMRLRISNEHVEEAFRIVRASGPVHSRER